MIRWSTLHQTTGRSTTSNDDETFLLRFCVVYFLRVGEFLKDAGWSFFGTGTRVVVHNDFPLAAIDIKYDDT